MTWAHHTLCGSELPVHGWRHVNGEIHLRVTLVDGSVGCLPVSWTDLLQETTEATAGGQRLTLASVRALRSLVETLAGQSHQERGSRSKRK